MQAVILAGGGGERLRPYTLSIPKPLLPIDDKPILEVILRQLKHFGIKDIILSVNYLSDLIYAFFNTGESLGINISYSKEEQPLGTAGPISMIDELEDTFIVMNGDVLTTIDYTDFLNFHRENNNMLSVATFSKEVKIDLGVINSEKGILQDYVEKPTYNFDVSMGVYIFNKEVLKFIPKNERMDVPDLIRILKNAGMKVGCYKQNCDWIDIGRFDDFEKAIDYFKEKRGEYLPYEESAFAGVK